jgi:flagellar basal body rod protein FlgG
LDILTLNDLTNPSLVKTYNLTNPHGLSKDGDLLFICDGADGLKVYNAGDANNLKLIKHFSNLETYDVIAYNNIALVVAKDGLYQYDYSDVNDIHLLSKINIAR